MKIKSFFAPNLVNALNIIETLYKKEAIIHSVTSVEQGVKVSVFIKQQKREFNNQQNNILEKKRYFSYLLKHHTFEETFIDQLVRATKNKSVKPNDDKLLPIAFEELFHFRPLYPMTPKKVYVFIGNSGAGKTTAIKKIANLAKKENFNPIILSIQKHDPSLITFSNENLIPIKFIDDIHNLNEAVTLARLQSDYILIDTPAFNPFDRENMKELKVMKNELIDGEFVLTMPAGLDEKEAIAQGALFHKNGADLLLVTKLDSHVKYSGICQTLLHNQLYLTAMSFSNDEYEAVLEASPSNFAKIFLLPNSKNEGA
ncbi:MAG: hypothetical protein J6V53_07350 [Alphaproteobacteria bacterium]|nr:hypothetical protein [Alphaproteobacteria bacterium]